MTGELLTYQELYEAWPILSTEDRRAGFMLLSRGDADELFNALDSRSQAELILSLPPTQQRLWMRFLAPDDAVDVIQAAPEERERLLGLLDDTTRREVVALLAYAEDDAGGLMNPRYARLRPDMTVDEAISYLRRQVFERVESVYYAYVLEGQRLLGVVSLRELFSAAPDKRIRDIMHTDLVTVREDDDQEHVSHAFAQHDLVAIPVVDAEGRMKGVVTVDDIVDVVREEATEDMHKLGAINVLDAPYLQVGLLSMIGKRAIWLVALFLGQTLTANVMEHFEDRIAAATVLLVFIPLIVSSGGNSGSQAATLVVRALALGELRLREWWRVARRELAVGLALGLILALLGLGRILLWHLLGLSHYTDHYFLVGLVVAGSLVAVVMWGTLVGSMLPLVLRRAGLDPASASTPFVATLCDVTGLVLYFTVASVILGGTLL